MWLLIAFLAVLDALATRDYVMLLDDSGTVSADALPLQRSVPSDYADAQTWVRYAIALQKGGPWQLRTTDIDNAPHGREVHWSSAFAHLVSAAGRLRRLATEEALPTATERALAWFNLPLFLIVVVVFSGWVAHRLGVPAAVLVALGMVGHPSFYAGFAANYVDHHGLLTASSFGIVLGATFMGAGWWRPPSTDSSLLPTTRAQARRGALVSALAGGVGMWISAPSVIPTIAMTGVAGLATIVWLGRHVRDEGPEFDGDVWRLWGRVGCAAALAAYAVEYAPRHLGMRLEVNHPLYALAWLGGGEFIALVGEQRIINAPSSAWRAVAAALAIVATPLAIAVGGDRVFALLDPGLVRLHEQIAEFHSLPSFIRAVGQQALGRFAIDVALVLPVLVLAWKGQRERILIAFNALIVLASVAMACWQIRWFLSASGPELCLLLTAVTILTATRSERQRWFVVCAIGAGFIAQAGARIQTTRSNVVDRAVTDDDAMEPLYRDIASSLRATQPDGEIVLLASPNASTGIGYFGAFKTLGTLYWENMDGLRAAAAVFSATTDDAARELMRARGVTHIAMVWKDDFVRTYLELTHPNASPDQVATTFGFRLLSPAGSQPRWLRPIPFRPRSTLSAGPAIRLFQVVPDQTELEAMWDAAIADVAARDAVGAEAAFRAAIALAAPTRRIGLFQSAATESYKWKDHALALRLLFAADSLEPKLSVRSNLAWILATSVDGAVRNAAAALAIADPLVRRSPDDAGALDAYAAALAGTGHFSDAVAVAERMVSLARTNRDQGAEALAQQRLQSYRLGRAWRQ